MKLFLDIDGVLLRDRLRPPEWSIAGSDFVDYVVTHFECYWLTTHCYGNARTAVDYLRPFAPDESIPLLQTIRPTTFDVYKTEALPLGDEFYWIDDAPMAGELQYLEENDMLARWLEVNVNRDPQSLSKCLDFLRLQ